MPVLPPIPFAPGRVYDPTRSENTIMQLMLHQGDVAANRAYNTANIWGNTVANLGQIAGKYVAQKQAEEDQQKKQAGIDSVLQSWDGNDPKQLIHGLGQYMNLPDAMKATAGVMSLQAAAQKNQTGGLPSDQDFQSFATGAHAIMKNAGPDYLAQHYPLLRQQWGAYVKAKYGVELPEQYTPEVGQQLGALVDTFGATKGEDETAVVGGALVSKKTGKVIYAAPEKERPVQHVDLGDKIGILDAQGNVTRTIPKGQAPGSDAAPALSPEGLDMAAEMFAKTGQMPPMGMGKAGATVRQAIINRAAALHPGADVASNKASYHADQASLGSMQKMVDSVSAFESTASKNSKILDGLLDKIPNYGSSWANKPARELSRALGSEDMAAFNTIRQSVANEYARIISNPTLAGVMSDSARQEGAALLDPNATPSQIRAAMKTLAAEAKNRHTEYQSQLDSIKGRLGVGKTAAPATGIDPEVQKRLDRWKTGGQ